MNILIIDQETMGLGFAMRAMDQGHYVKLWAPEEKNQPHPFGEGIVDRPAEWKRHMGWADLIILTGNSQLQRQLAPYFKGGYPIFAPDSEGTSLELDREKGQAVLEEHNIPILEGQEFHDFEDAIAYVLRTDMAYACKPWGGTADKALSYVADSPEDLVFTLRKWQADGKKPDFILQQKVDGIEVGVASFFGPGGWAGMIEESWEEKKFLTGGLGPNTGEMGTTIRYTQNSVLFDRVLAPLEQYLLSIGYVGDVSVNCMIDENGVPWPLEFTCRLGWPDFNIRMHLHIGDLAQHILDCVHGRSTFQCLEQVAVGVLMMGDYPNAKTPSSELTGAPLRGLTEENLQRITFQNIMWGKAPVKVGGQIKDRPCYVTAGDYILTAVGVASSVSHAQDIAYNAIDEVSYPGTISPMYRIDIGDRLKKELPRLQALGYCADMVY